MSNLSLVCPCLKLIKIIGQATLPVCSWCISCLWCRQCTQLGFSVLHRAYHYFWVWEFPPVIYASKICLAKVANLIITSPCINHTSHLVFMFIFFSNHPVTSGVVSWQSCNEILNLVCPNGNLFLAEPLCQRNWKWRVSHFYLGYFLKSSLRKNQLKLHWDHLPIIWSCQCCQWCSNVLLLGLCLI